MRNPVVGIIMGSDSDLPVMKDAALALEEMNVPYECQIVSAHRTPERMFHYAKQAEERNLRILIAGAGGAAHLPGMVASLTLLPVIGVPVKGKNLEGVDSLYSIVQMPKGIPVATVAINGAYNAGLLACSILALEDPRIKEALRSYRVKNEQEVEQKARRLLEEGYRSYEPSTKG